MRRIASLPLLAPAFLVTASMATHADEPKPAAAPAATPVASAPACTQNYIWAQKLVDDALARHPEVVSIVFHVTPPGAKDNIVIASNLWINGKVSDSDDLGVISSGKTMTETNKAVTKFEVQGVLKNVLGATVGSVAIIFPYKKGDNQSALEKKAEGIRAELSQHILNAGNLMEPFPFDPQIPWNTYAQSLTAKFLKKYPDLLIFTIHATPPNRQGGVIVASNISRIGKPDDEKDLDVLKTAKPFAGLKAADQRAQVIVPLKDASGATIGIFNILMHNGTNGDEAAMIAKGETIRDDVAKQIPNAAKLFEPSRP